MGEPFIGSEAVACGEVARKALQTQYTRVFPDVYVPIGAELTRHQLAHAGWLWSRRRGIVAGLTAAALHGVPWVDTAAPVEVIHNNRNSLTGLKIRGDRIDDDEIVTVGGLPVTSPARTALDLACWYPTGEAVATIDALARATGLDIAEVDALAERYSGRRSIRWARTSLSLVDAGAATPQETWLRLQLVKGGLPTPTTQIPVPDESGGLITHVQMGWPSVKVAAEYDGPAADRWQQARDIRRLEALEKSGWLIIRVAAGDRTDEILRRVRTALVRRGCQRNGGRRASR